jgi:hypothetical protein
MRNSINKYLFAATMFAVGIQPANACWNSTATDALQIKHLNTMLMATALRCRNTGDNFLPEYNKFVNKYNILIGQQNGIVRAELAKTLGPKGALAKSDNLSVGFANTYGAGHPNMDCGALKDLMLDIADGDENAATLSDLAGRVVLRSEVPGVKCTVEPKKIAGK